MKQSIVNFPVYEISEDGIVFNKKTGKQVKQKKDVDGYYYARLHKQGKTYNVRVHRLVAQAFIPNPENKPCVDHINTIPSDNRAINLRWATWKENNDNPLTKEKRRVAKLMNSNNKRKKIMGIHKDTNEKIYYESIGQTRKDGFTPQLVHRCINGCRITHKEYKWYALD